MDLIIGFLIDLFSIAIVAYTAFQFGYWYRGMRIMQEMSKQIHRTNTIITKLSSENVNEMMEGVNESAKLLDLTVLKHEVIDGKHFFYTSNTDTFMAQGSTLEEAAQQYAKNNSTVGCVADPSGKKDSYFIVNGKITTTLQK
jgi:ribosomal protein L31